jgi:hypothetical protein
MQSAVGDWLIHLSAFPDYHGLPDGIRFKWETMAPFAHLPAPFHGMLPCTCKLPIPRFQSPNYSGPSAHSDVGLFPCLWVIICQSLGGS